MSWYKETNFIGCDMPFNSADFVIAGIPYDGTSSFRPGSRFGPDAIRRKSYAIETFSPELKKDLADYKICDAGNLEFPFGNRTAVLSAIEAAAAEIIAAEKKSLYIGGEHLITVPLVKKYHEKYPGLKVIHWDAHADMRDDYMGEKLSHATVARRITEIVGDKSHYMFGIRSGEKQEYDYIKEKGIFCDPKFELWAETMKKLKKFPVYFTLDLDVFDPACIPGLGTPEAGGIFFHHFMDFIKEFQGMNIVGMDVVEMAPDYDPAGNSAVFAAKVARELILSAV
ncbi:MAG TPA: agmatinase [bacterium]|mgnify:CR=1 FL=1|nr:agmatinase [bacterium]